MKAYSQQQQSVPETVQPKASKQAAAGDILQAYKDRIVQQETMEEDELLQGKFGDTAQREEFEEDELLQGKFGEVAQREEFEEDELLQGKFSGVAQREDAVSPLPGGGGANQTGMPDNLKNGIEALSGYSMDDVRVHYNSAKPVQLQALAYAQGTDIHIAPGQEQHLPHEAWHVVQQKQGRVQRTMQLQGVNVNDNEGLEKEADVMGGRSVQRKINGSGIINVNTSCEVIQGSFYVKRGKDYFWHGEDVNENLYIKTDENKYEDELTYDDGSDEAILESLFYRENRYIYPVYKERILDLTVLYPNTKSNEAAKKDKARGEIGTPTKEHLSDEFKTTSSIYNSLNQGQQQLFNQYLNNIRPYCSEDGITGLIEGALKNVKNGSVLAINNRRAKDMFINRLKLMTEYVSDVGEKMLGEEKIKDKYFIESTGSDPHANGSHALFLINRSDSKDRIVYKPHSLEFENAFMGKGGFLEYLNTLKQHSFATMDLDPTTHTEEFISRVGDKDSSIREEIFKQYMKQLGMLQIASHVFGITDLHCENIIFGEDGPIAIDAECGGAFGNTRTGIEDDYAPVMISESTLANPSALYVGGQQKKDTGNEYMQGKAEMSGIIKRNSEAILLKCSELLNGINKFRILPFGTGKLAEYLDIYISRGFFSLKYLNEIMATFITYFEGHPIFNDNIILELDKFYSFFFDAIEKGTLPAFEFDLENKVILLDDNSIGHIEPGIDIKQRMIEQMQVRINGLIISGASN